MAQQQRFTRLAFDEPGPSDFTNPTLSDDVPESSPGLNGGESMAAGNMLSVTPDFGAPGSPSEQTQEKTYDPRVVSPEVQDYRPLISHDDGGPYEPGEFLE